MSGMEEARSIPIGAMRRLQGPLVDVRSPSEFARGHWPGAVNLPLFSDDERAAVGTCYKQKGRGAAVHLGLNLTGPKLGWLADQLEQLRGGHPPRIYCWRGGMRSASIGWLAEQIDLNPNILQGGYKAYRRWAQALFDLTWPLRLMGGRTGTGKTDLLLALERRGIAILDLEGMANHRGSSFGGLGLPAQPTTEHYENKLAEALDRQRLKPAPEIWVEAESIQVGCCRIPKGLFDQMKTAPVLEIQRSLDERVQQLVGVYGHQGAEGLAEATRRISRRLGPQRTKEALDAIGRGDWATACRATLDYYDHCYDREMARTSKRQSVDLSGTTAAAAAERLICHGLIVVDD